MLETRGACPAHRSRTDDIINSITSRSRVQYSRKRRLLLRRRRLRGDAEGEECSYPSPWLTAEYFRTCAAAFLRLKYSCFHALCS